jgi:uncharacterized protein
MKNFLSTSILVGAMVMTIAGCGSSPATKFYVLSSPSDIQQMAGKTDDSCPAIGVGPIIMPEHLTKPQIATTPSENEVAYSPFDQWAQPLSGNFAHVLAENLSKLVCNEAVYQFPWTGTHEPDYRVRVEVISMTGSMGLKAFMDAWWTISETKEKKTILSRRTHYSESVRGQDYQALAQAYSKILAAFSRDIAKAIPSQ